MKRVVYFLGGIVADFEIEDEDYDAFAAELKSETGAQDKQLLEHSRLTLEAFVIKSEESQSRTTTELERAAACFVWRYFNENEDKDLVFGDDVIVIDETGSGENVQYAPLGSVNLSPA